MAFEQEITFKTVVDDNGVAESFNQTNELIEQTNESANDLNKTLDKTLRPREVGGLTEGVNKSTKALKGQNTQVSKNTRSMGKFNRVAGRGVSAVSRLTGANSKATRSLAGLAFGLASTPFGAFAVAASAASLAYSLFSSKTGASNEDLIKQNDELRKSISQLDTELNAAFRDAKLLQVDLSSLSEADKRTKEIAIRAERQGELRVELSKLNNKETLIDNQLNKVGFNLSNKSLELQKELLTVKKDRQRVATEIVKEDVRINQVNEEGAKEAKRRRDQAIADEKARNKLIASLVRDELKKRIDALKLQASEREKQFKERGASEAQLSSFVKNSQKVLGEDIQALRDRFNEQRIKAERAVQAQLIKDGEEGEKLQAKMANEKLVKDISNLEKTEGEKAELVKQANEILNQELAEITKRFADERKAQAITEQDELFEVKLAATEAEIRRQEALLTKEQELEKQAFQSQVRSEEEITAFNKKQSDEKLKNELLFSIERLRIAKEFNKQLTEVEKQALDAQIDAFKTRLSGVGGELKQSVQAEGGASNGLFGLLGLSDKQVENTQAIQGALEDVTQAVSQAVAQRVQLLDEEVQKRESSIDTLKGDLDREIKLRELGKASNIKQVQEELAQEKAARDKAIKEKEKAAKAQFLLDTALQTSNLVTAVSNLYSTLSGLPFGTGVALATVLSAAMIGAFASSKITAAEAAGFAEGGYWSGDYGYTGGGGKYEESSRLGNKDYTYHKDEYIIPSEKVKQYGLENVPVNQLDKVLGGHFSESPISASGMRNANRRISKHKEVAEAARQERKAQAISNGLKSEFATQNKILKEQLKELKSSAEIVPLGNNRYRIKTGNKTEYITLEN